MRIGIYGGTFNPVHIGHVEAARAFIAEADLDRLFVIPNSSPPLKANQAKVGALAADRMAMLKIAFADMEKVTVDDYEIRQKGVSYTYKTVSHFKKTYPDATLCLLIGDDNLLIFDKWKRPKYLLNNTSLYIALRSGADITEVMDKVKNQYCADITLLTYIPVKISSTQLRVTPTEDYLPIGVAKYISERGLYKD